MAPSSHSVSKPGTPAIAITEFCFKHWRTALLEPSRKAIQQALHALLRSYRDSILHDAGSESVDTAIIRATIRSYQELDPGMDEYYAAEWETPFLNDTTQYYSEACASFLLNETVSSYLGFCDRVLDLEDIVSSQFLLPSTMPKHKEAVNRVLIIAHQDVLQEALSGFVAENRSDDLKRIYRLFDRIQELDPLLEIFQHFVDANLQKTFADLVLLQSQKDFPRLYCATFLEKYYSFAEIISYAFNDNLRFSQLLERSGRRALNNNPVNREGDPADPSARHAAKLSDELLTDPRIPYQELCENRMYLQGVKLLFTLLASKDVFCKSYKILFCNRLLRNKIHSRDAENAMILLMRGAHDLQFSHQLMVMIRDVDSSKTKYGLDSGFLTSDIPCDPMILTASSWPLNSHDLTLTLKLPDELAPISAQFVERFHALTEGKAVEWLHERSTALIEFRGKTKLYRITVNHFQLATMMAFNRKAVLSADELIRLLDLPPDWLEATLKSLTSTRLLQQNPTNKLYRLNPSFEAQLTALNAALHFYRPVLEAVIDPTIEEQRDMNTQAAIVRIMKARRVLDHTTLCDETTRQTSRFFPQKIDRIKRQIEKLINGQEQYLERIDHKTYKYVTGVDA